MATARAFIAEGARVLLAGVSEPDLRAGAAELGERAAWKVTDVTDSAQVQVPHLTDGASIIITSSVVGLTAAPHIAGYSTAKHAQVGLMRTLAAELAPRAIRVNTIHPGPVDNEFQHRVEEAATGADRAAARTIFDAMIPLGRHAAPDEIARAMVFLASDDSSFMTGATLPVDGGMSS